MSIIAIKNGIANAFSSKKKNSFPQERLVDPNSPNYSSVDRTQDLSNEEAEIQTVQNDCLSKGFSDGEDDEETKKRSILSILDKVNPRVMSDVIIGLSDGLTVPFALTAGLSSLGDSKLVITGGFAELISGAISMGLGGYLAAKSESDFYQFEYKSEKQKLYSNIQQVNHEVEDILLEINEDFSEETIVSFVKDMKKTPKQMLDFVIRFGKGLEEPAENRQVTSALTIGFAYFLGGFVPLIPYFFFGHVLNGLIVSIITMGFTLFLFGYVKTQVSLGDQCSTWKKISEATQMMLVGGCAAGSAWFFVRIIG